MTERHEYIDTALLFSMVEEELQNGRKVSFTVTGMSMWPFICHGRDSVILRAVDPAVLKVGDIVLFKIPVYEKYLLHRITKLENSRFVSTGDGNCFRDGCFPLSCVIGVVETIEYKGRPIAVSSPIHRLPAALWRLTYPIRPLLLKLLRFGSKIKQRLAGARH